MNKFKNGVVVGRFQPFHNGHVRYVLKSLDHCEHLFIGITTPGSKPTQYEPKDPMRFGPRNNPFSYDERVEMVKLGLADRQVSEKKYTILQFDPTQVEKWHEVIPKDAVYFLILTNPEENQKVAEMEAQGLTVQVLDELSDRDFVGVDIRKKMMSNEPWDKLLPASVAAYLEKIDGKKRIRGLWANERT